MIKYMVVKNRTTMRAYIVVLEAIFIYIIRAIDAAPMPITAKKKIYNIQNITATRADTLAHFLALLAASTAAS